MDFELLRRECGLTKNNCAQSFNVTTRTIKKWGHSDNPPVAVRKCLQ